MIISKSPLRVSFFGGGTDLPKFYKKYEGSVLSTAISRYIYVSVKDLNESYKEKYRLNYSITERKSNISEIKNNIIRETLRYMKINSNIYISTIADVPLRSGLGSSSSFTSGLVSALAYKENIILSKKELAQIACEIEITKLKSPIGKQDQYASVYGGINKINFHKNGEVSVKKIILSKKFRNQFEKSFLLLWSGVQRSANNVLLDQSKKIISNVDYYKEIKNITKYGYNIFNKDDFDINKFSDLLSESWQLKTRLSSKILTPKTKKILEIAKLSGALSSKICGAGNGGFILICAKPKYHQEIKNALSDYTFHKFNIEDNGVETKKI